MQKAQATALLRLTMKMSTDLNVHKVLHQLLNNVYVNNFLLRFHIK